ncbi:hypothetical protein MHB77_32480 [Paenibacillus sp. FSL K6-3166]|uniref:hypothetical protein n=1 Tax=unclassified Paenibacillus TaxID=185978 RepID=UPI000BCD655A|nr:hypothetical protein [Paenibacillus sp. VTT E-133291]OZQ84683.1 hypothetical protein CA598_23090 [Paenibacillus sp. VTT E-133291]
MSMFTKVGAEAVAAGNNEGGAKDSPITSFKSGAVYKVGVKSINDVAEYYGYGMFGKVNTHVPKNPPVRNAKGFVQSNPCVWDKASELLYADAKAAMDSGASEAEVKPIKDEAYLFKGKKRYLRAFHDLTTGKDIVVDLSPNQEKIIKSVIEENIDDLDVIAFKLSKKGSGQSAAVSLNAIVKMDRDLTEEERANFAKLGAAPFDLADFETCLYVADDAEQTKNLVIAGFDIGRLGLSIGANAGTSTQTPPPADADTPLEITEEELPF